MSVLHGIGRVFIPRACMGQYIQLSYRMQRAMDLDAYVRPKTLGDAQFATLFEHGEQHPKWLLFVLFQATEHNQFHAPWDGQWLTARQAHRLLARMYGTVPTAPDLVCTAVLQFVVDWWNIRHVFGADSAHNARCGHPDLEPTSCIGPRRRLTTRDLLMLW